jgi:hypothetical protein
MSPVKNWYYNSSPADVGDSNIAENGSATAHGIHWYELKPALKATAVLSAMEAKYGITFTGDFCPLIRLLICRYGCTELKAIYSQAETTLLGR